MDWRRALDSLPPASKNRRHGAQGTHRRARRARALAAGRRSPPTPARARPGQRVDLKVLLLSADGTEPGFGAWKAALEREGVPYDTLVAYDGQTRAATLTDARLADYGADHARYQAMIVATGDLGHAVTNPDGTTSYPVGADRRRVGDAGEVRAHASASAG